MTGTRVPRTVAALTAAVACAVVMGGCTTSSTPAAAEQGDIATVTRVVDGDTIIVAPERGGGTIRVRLIGVDTPETVKPETAPQCYGREASDRTHQLADHATVRLEFDSAVDRVDRYGRTLAYVWLPDNRMLNTELLAGGYAREYDYNQQRYRHRDDFRGAESSARRAHRGLWSSCT